MKPNDRINPIRPEDVNTGRRGVPDGVIEAINELIQENRFLKGARFTQNQAVDRILMKMNRGHAEYRRADVFEKKWLNFESAFEANGWKVEYDRPGYNEMHDATFTFTPKRITRGGSR